MRLAVYILCLFLGPLAGKAQDTTIRYVRPANVIVKLAPLWLLDPDPSVMGGLEIRTGARTSIQGEIGYGWPDWNNPGSNNRHAGTWRFKSEMRFYRGKYRTNRVKNIRIQTTYPLGNYVAVEAYAKLLAVDHTWRYVDSRAATEQMAVTRQTRFQRNSLSLSVKFGRQVGWTDLAHQATTRLLLDVYGGVGIRFLNQDNKGQWGEPGYQEMSGMFNRFNANGFVVAPTINLGLKLGFAL